MVPGVFVYCRSRVSLSGDKQASKQTGYCIATTPGEENILYIYIILLHRDSGGREENKSNFGVSRFTNEFLAEIKKNGSAYIENISLAVSIFNHVTINAFGMMRI